MPSLTVWNVVAEGPDGTKLTAEVRTSTPEKGLKAQYERSHPGMKFVSAARAGDKPAAVTATSPVADAK
jgi:hypothetical protein